MPTAAATLREALQAGEARERELSARLDRNGAADAARGEALETRAAAAEAKRDELAAEVLALTAAAAEQRLRAEALEGRAGAAEERARDADARGAELAKARDAATAAAADAEARHKVEASLRAAVEEKEAAERRERTAALAQLLALQTKQESDAEAHRVKTAALAGGRAAGEAAFAAAARLAARALDDAAEAAAAREAELTSLKAEVERANEVDAAAQARALAEAQGTCATLERRLEAAEADAARARAAGGEQLEALEEKLRAAEATRRKLHNTIQELRGNIRVFARVRPFLPGDGDADARKPAVEPGADGVSLALAGEAEGAPRSPTRGGEHDKRRPRKRETYAYDRVFGPEVGQEEVFGEVSEFVQSALDGYQVCLLSYGQTGFVSASFARRWRRVPPRRHRRDPPPEISQRARRRLGQDAHDAGRGLGPHARHHPAGHGAGRGLLRAAADARLGLRDGGHVRRDLQRAGPRPARRGRGRADDARLRARRGPERARGFFAASYTPSSRDV